MLKQWQIELREKFNLNWPIYDGRKLSRYPSRALQGHHEHEVDPRRWHEEPVVIASSHLMRRKDRAAVLVDDAEPWDLIVVDEAHHARRRAAGSPQEGGPNTLLKLMRALKTRTQGLVLLTATPMQVHPIEVWDLLDLLGLPRSGPPRSSSTSSNRSLSRVRPRRRSTVWRGSSRPSNATTGRCPATPSSV